ncbi:FG-GAP repeat domain-containing protein [Endothiovibrio diazotrophicus]
MKTLSRSPLLSGALAILALLGSPLPAAHAQATAGERSTLFESNRFAAGGWGILAADFDEDGLEDLATTSQRLVSIRLSSGDGRFTVASELELPGTRWQDTMRVVGADFNGDGHLDLAVFVIGWTERTASLFMGRGDGTFSAADTLTLDAAIETIAAADTNRDGAPDLLLAGAENDPPESDHRIGFIQPMWGDGRGGFRLSPTHYPTGGNDLDPTWEPYLPAPAGPKAAVASDLDGDGNPDLVVATCFRFWQARHPGHLSVLYGDGHGGFRAPTTLDDGECFKTVAIADFNGDGHPDLVASAPSREQLLVHLADGAGGFGEPLALAADVGTIDLATADLDGDGAVDIVAGSSAAVTILPGDGNGAFPAPYSFPDDVTSVRIADFNGDTRPDLLLTGEHGATTLLNDGDPLRPFHFPFIPPFAVTGAMPTSAVSGDFDGDGHPDIVTADSGTRTVGEPDPATGLAAREPVSGISLYRGDGRGGLTAAGWWEIGAGGLGGLTTTDLDGDGNADLVAADGSAGEIVLLYGDGQGDFPFTATLPVEGTLRSVTPADLDGDGRPDLIAATARPNQVALFLGAEGRTFTTGAIVPLGNPPQSRSLADFNGDGHPDLMVSTAEETGPIFNKWIIGDVGQLELLAGDGNGGLQVPEAFNIGRVAQAVRATDFDGDETADLLVYSAPPYDRANGELLLLHGNGDGSFASPSVLVSAPDFSYLTHLTAADFDGDGHPDVAAVLFSDLRLLFGDGSGGITESADFTLGGYVSGATVVDLNGDGGPELVSLIPNLPAVSVLLHRSTASADDCPTATLTADLATLHLPQVDYRNLTGETTIALELARDPALGELVYRVERVETADATQEPTCSSAALSPNLALELPELHYRGDGGDARFAVWMEYRTIDGGDYFEVQRYQLLGSP